MTRKDSHAPGVSPVQGAAVGLPWAILAHLPSPHGPPLRRRFRLWIPFAVSLAAVLSLAGCSGDPAQAPDEAGPEPPVAAEVWTVVEKTLLEERRWSGRLEPLHTATFAAPGPARVEAVGVRNGDRVESGALLLRLAPPALEARREVLAERLETLEGELARWRRLAESGAAGPAELSEATLRTLAVREELEALAGEVDRYRIQASRPGRVAAVAVAPGDQVEAGQLLLRLDDIRTVGVRLLIPAREAMLLERTDQLTLRDARGGAWEVDGISFTPDMHPGFVSAELRLRGEAGDSAIGSGSGWMGQVDVSYSASEEVALVPWTSVASEGDGHWVARVSGDPLRVQRTPVTLGRAHAEGVEVLEGLRPGDRVLRYEPRSVPDGREIEPLGPTRG